MKFVSLTFVMCLLWVIPIDGFSVESSQLMPLNRYFPQSWGTKDGLPHNSIHALAQTSNGYLWAGTWEGVARFNGQQFTVFTRGAQTGLPDSGIRSLYYNKPRDELLVAGNRGGVTSLIAEQWHAQAPLSSMVNHAFRDSNNVLWFALEDTGIAMRTPDGTQKEYIVNSSAYRIIEDGFGVIWFATSQGLFKYINDKFQLAVPDHNILSGPSFTLALDSKKRVLVGTEHGVWQQKNGTFALLHSSLADKSISSILLDHQNSIWVGTINHGLYRLSDLGLEKLDATAGLPNNRVFSLLEDLEKNIWIGTNGGLFRLRRALFTTFSQSQGMSGDFLRTVLQTSDGKLLSGGSAGLDIFSNDAFSSASLTTGEAFSVLSLAAVTEEVTLVGTYTKGVLRYENDQLTPYLNRHLGLPSNEVRAILLASDNSVWYATAQGVVQQTPDGKLSHFNEQNGLPAHFSMGLAEDREGRIWIATGTGLAYIQQGIVHTVSFPEHSDAQHAFSFSVVEKGTWITTDRGLAYFDNATQALSVIEKSQGLPVDKLFSIGIDHNSGVWLSSNQGVILTSLSSLKACLTHPSALLEFEHFKEENGLASIQINGGSQPSQFVDVDGNVWLPTAKGLATVTPANLAMLSEFPIPVSIEAVLLDGADQQFDADKREVDVAPLTTRVAFQYAGLGFAMPSRIEYQAMLVGYDQDWVNRHQFRMTEYTNLAPGRYQFKVRARYIGGPWREITSPFSIRVLPSIYQTFAFKFSVFLFFCFVIYALYKVRFHHLKKSEMILKQRVDEQTRSLELQTKRFEFQATHDDLTGIANRRAFDRWLVQYFEEAKAKQSPLCLAVIDIDHFKQVNDQYSHLVGDKVITEVARILNREVPHYAKCARWGGEEFTVLLPEYDLINARVAMDHVRKIVAAHDFSFIAQTLKVTISIGVASADGARDHDRMLTHADQALYTAKENGRNQVTIFE